MILSLLAQGINVCTAVTKTAIMMRVSQPPAKIPAAVE
jgi:hypothetical protein